MLKLSTGRPHISEFQKPAGSAAREQVPESKESSGRTVVAGSPGRKRAIPQNVEVSLTDNRTVTSPSRGALARGLMERIQCVLLMLSMMSLGAGAQAPKSATDQEAAPQTHQIAPISGLTSQDRADQSLASAAQQRMTGSAAVSTSGSASFSPLPVDESPASIPNANSELQSQIQEALSKDPNLCKCSVVVTASAEGIDLTGSAGSSRERLAVWRLAESYARGKKVENHIVVNGKSGTAPGPSRPENAGAPSNAARTNGSSPGLQNNEFR
jgi:hypothetical protein